jgi:signal transduction histidine kinase
MRFRTKLLLILAVPVLALTTIAALAAADVVPPTELAILAAASTLVSTTLGLLLVRRTSGPLRTLAAAADALANEQLPAILDGLGDPSEEDQRFLTVTIQPVQVKGNDEIGQLARAFNSIQTTAVDLAAEQSALLRKGIGELFVNLARRNQLLIDRQLEMFDALEAREDDPDDLAKLYKLDHLATRMRRNAESLLVLAGVEPSRRRTKPVPLVDVVRAAIGETEDFERVDLATLEDVDLHGIAAIDLGHLLAELLENATHFSPPDARVVIDGRATRGYMLSITDAGLGMDEQQIADANALFDSPPPVGLALTRTLGLTVVARLAARHGVGVRLAAAPTGGVTAVVHVPSHLLAPAAPSAAAVDVDVEEPSRPAVEPPAPPVDPQPVDAHRDDPHLDEADFEDLVRSAWADEPNDAGWITPDDDVDPLPQRAPKHLARAPEPEGLADALPQGAAFERGVARLQRGDEGLGPATLVEPPIALGDPVGPNALARRMPKPVAPPAPAPTAPSIRSSTRSPEEVRSMLERYRQGIEGGRAGEAPAPGPDSVSRNDFPARGTDDE